MGSERIHASKQPVRVLFFDHTAALGGGEIALFNLITYLDLDAVKPVVILGAEGPLVAKLRSTCETYVLPLPSGVATRKKDTLGFASLFRLREVFEVIAYVWSLARFIRRHDIDLIHTNSLKADIVGGFAGRLARRPVIWHVRDRINRDYLPSSIVRAFRLLCRVIPTYLIANSAATLRTIYPQEAELKSSEMPDTAREGSKTVVHDGTIVTPIRNQRTIDTGLFRIGLIGRISPWKGQHIFLEAAARVFEGFPNTRFVIIGAPLFGEIEYEDAIKRLPKALGIGEVVDFTGFRSDIAEVIDGLDLVVHASTIGEPFGQVIIEGMAAGKPIVATDGGGVPEIIRDGDTGILVPMADAPAMADGICKILGDPERARKMGLRGRERVEKHFTVQLTARKVEAIYRRVLRRSN